MKKYIGFIVFLFSLTLQGQSKKEIKELLKKTNTKENVKKHIADNPNWEIELINLNNTDADFPKKLAKLKKGASKILKLDNQKYHYKLLNNNKETQYRVSYIYLNGSELTKKQIDSIRSIVIEKYKSGITFEELVSDYNMDTNSKKGDLGWFKSGVMFPDFEKEIVKHKKGAIFFVNIVSKNWYYVVLKTYDDRELNTMTLVKIKEQ